MKKGTDQELYKRVKEMLIRSLRLRISPEDIKNDAPLIGGGADLDSIDALEVVLNLEKEFGVRIADIGVAEKVFASVDSIVEFVKQEKRNDKNKP